MLHDVVSARLAMQVRGTVLPPGMRTSSTFNIQHVAESKQGGQIRTCCAQQCCDHETCCPNNVAISCDGLARACKCWASYVGISCVEMLRSFSRGFKTSIAGVSVILWIPLTNRVRGPYRKLRTEFFPLRFMAQARSVRAINRREKTRIGNLQYGPRRRG